MSVSVNRFNDPQPAHRPPEDLDGLLRKFFRAEVPDPWPALQLRAEQASSLKRTAPSRKRLSRSRMALAASLLLMLICHFWMSGFYRNAEPDAPEPASSRFEATHRNGARTSDDQRPKEPATTSLGSDSLRESGKSSKDQ